MLYDGSIRFMESGKQAILAKDLQKQNDQLQRAQKIVLELMSSLDMQKGGEIAQNLLGLYTFVIEQLIEANMKDLTGPVDESIKIMSSLRESWVQIESQNLAGQSLKEIASVA
jgi:flagellar protein FliS